MYELAQRVGSVFQNPKSQFFNLDTDSELAFGLENEGRPPEEIRRRVEQVAETLHLQELRGKTSFSVRWAKAASGLWLCLCHGP